ncbi:MAG: EamA family transporter [Bacteroidales bacterium]|nr:EamA family transporter [Bacteroidales bacterium]
MKKLAVYSTLFFASVLWGVSFIMTKEISLTAPNMTALHIITFRMFLASVVMIPLLAVMCKLERIRKGDLKWFLLLSFAEPFLYSFLETSGILQLDGSLAAVVIATIPLFVPFGMAAVYKERIQWLTMVGILLSLVGIGVMLMGHGSTATGGQSVVKGLLFLAGAVVVAVIYTLILVKVVDHYRPITITAYQNLIGLVYYLPVMLLVDGDKLGALEFSPKVLLLLLALGIFCSTIAYACYNYGIRHIGATASCIFTNTIPVFSMIAAVAIGQEHFSLVKVAGMAIVIVGVVIVQVRARTGQMEGEK